MRECGLRISGESQCQLPGDPHRRDRVQRSLRALEECRIEGIATNLSLLRAIAARPEFATQAVHTRFVEAHLADLLAAAARLDASEAKAARGTPLRAVAATPPEEDDAN